MEDPSILLVICMFRSRLFFGALLWALLSVLLASTASAQPAAKPKRAALPKWEKFPSDIFYKDAFKEGLIGPRPATLGGQTKSTYPDKPNPDNDKPAGFAWTQVISPQTLEDEVKSLNLQVQKSVTTPGKFSGGGYQDVRRQFTELATLFAVIANYDGKVRWIDEAPHARDAFARAAANAKVTSIQAFNDAKQRKLDLEELVRGGTLNSNKPTIKENDWEKVCDRRPLMQRIETGYREGLEIWAGKASSFEANLAKVKREAELLKLFGVVLMREGMEDAGDDDYDAYCRQLIDAAEAMVRAAQDKDAVAAKKANGLINKSCVQCHDDYRG